jgi:hypothetical protein
MPSDTVYKGRPVRLTATQNASGKWTGSSQITDEADHTMQAEGEFSTPDEARQAALSKAISAIDQDRRFRGKP